MNPAPRGDTTSLKVSTPTQVRTSSLKTDARILRNRGHSHEHIARALRVRRQTVARWLA